MNLDFLVFPKNENDCKKMVEQIVNNNKCFT